MIRALRAAVLHGGVLMAAAGTAGAAVAQPLSIDRLQRLLQQQPQVEVRFTELRESRWLAEPIESSGTLRSSASVLERRVEVPRRETWRILDDRMQLVAADSDKVMEIPLDKAPAMAALAKTLRGVMAGKLEVLGTDFELALTGDERGWSLQLTPRQPDVARRLRQITVQGVAGRLSTIVILESQGDRTTTRIQNPE